MGRSDAVPLAPTGSLGVLGGMGPAATADFLRRLAELTPAKRDQDHIPVIVYADPTTPDRSDAWERGAQDPLPKLLAGIRFLTSADVRAIAIPCNSAHLWYDQMQAATSVPILHIADAVIARLQGSLPAASSVGLLATEGTLRSGLYQDRLRAAGHATLQPAIGEPTDQVMAGIRAVKGGDVEAGREILTSAVTALVERGASVVVIACTDISVALADDVAIADRPVLDASLELALSSIRALHEDPPSRSAGADPRSRTAHART